MCIVGGSGGEAWIVAEIALQEEVDGFFKGAMPFAHVAGEAGVELRAPVGFDEDEAVEGGAHVAMRGDFAIGEQDAGGGDADLRGGGSGDGVEDRLADGAARPEIAQDFPQAGQIVAVGMRAVAAMGGAAGARQAEVVEREDARAVQMVPQPAGEGGFAAAAGAADADDKRHRGGGGFAFQPGLHAA